MIIAIGCDWIFFLGGWDYLQQVLAKVFLSEMCLEVLINVMSLGIFFLSGGKELLLRFLLTRKLDGFLLGTGEPTKGYSIACSL